MSSFGAEKKQLLAAFFSASGEAANWLLWQSRIAARGPKLCK